MALEVTKYFIRYIAVANYIQMVLLEFSPFFFKHLITFIFSFYFRITASILGFIGLTIAGVLFYQWWKRKQILLRRERLLEMATRARLERQRTQPRNQLSEDSFTCIVCLNQPREVILLPCGHISMCYDCAYQCNDRPCPVCREPVASINLIYFS